ncbi:MAG TPA: aspartate aminotransferase family protein [Candidatus Eremiobacteraceae bacterium]|nr:aspartate aminotransferase family protein [Candidatus Eremiobacteraceae bacterium]
MRGHVFYRKLNVELPTIVRGKGVYLYDADGKRYLDGSGGAMVACIGHGVDEIADAIAEQARTIAYVNGTAFTNRPVEELADMLAEHAPPGVDLSYFLSSGSEAVEAALKLSRQYHVERGETQRRIIIARSPGYHGNTLLALSASARASYRKMYAPWLLDVVMIDAPYPYRAGELGVDAPAMTGEALAEAIARVGAGNIAAFIAEPIGGSSTGASVPPDGYYARIRELCDEHGILFIADEVLCGAGRTGKYFGLEHYTSRSGGPVVPDIITMGKGLNAGYAPLSALLVKRTIFETIKNGSGGFQHAQTYSHNPLAAAAALAVAKYVRKHDLVARAASLEPELQRRLRTLLTVGDGAHIVGDVRGIGALAGVEIVADHSTKTPFPRGAKAVETLVKECLKAGLCVWPNVGQADGTNGDLIMIAPPFNISFAELDELTESLRAALAATASALHATHPPLAAATRTS